MTRSRIVIVTAIAVLASVAVAGAAALRAGPFAARSSASPSRDPGPVLATVDGRPVYLSEMRSRIEGVKTVHGDFEKLFGKDWPSVLLQNLVDDKIVEVQAAALGITVTPQELQAHVDELRGRFADEQAFQDWLRAGLMDEQELADRILLQTLASELYLKVTADVRVTPDQLRRYFEHHRADYPGVDGQGAPFMAVKGQIRQDVTKRERDRAYAAWLQTQRERVHVVVVTPDWWKEFA